AADRIHDRGGKQLLRAGHRALPPARSRLLVGHDARHAAEQRHDTRDYAGDRHADHGEADAVDDTAHDEDDEPAAATHDAARHRAHDLTGRDSSRPSHPSYSLRMTDELRAASDAVDLARSLVDTAARALAERSSDGGKIAVAKLDEHQVVAYDLAHAAAA